MNDRTLDSYCEMRNEIMDSTLNDIASGVQVQPWNLIGLDRAKKIWSDFAKRGFVRDEKGVEKISRIVTENILKIDVNTELCGHMSGYPYDEVESVGLTEEEVNESPYFDVGITWRVSDYALNPMLSCLFDLIESTSPEETLLIIDRVLSISHQRSNLASWFIEGGAYGLDELGGFDEK